jgi:hypothetical protein
MKIYPREFPLIQIAAFLWFCTSSSFALISTSPTRWPGTTGATRVFFAEKDTAPPGNDTDMSFAAYQESLKGRNGGDNAASSASQVYQDQYGRTIQRPSENVPTPTFDPVSRMDGATKYQQPQYEQAAETANESTSASMASPPEPSTEPALSADESILADPNAFYAERQPSNDGRSSDERPRRTLLDYSNMVGAFPSQRVGHDRLQPVERVFVQDKSHSQEAKREANGNGQSAPPSSSQASRAPSPADTSSPRKSIELMTLTDRLQAFPSERVGHDRLEPARRGTTTPPKRDDAKAASSPSTSSSRGRRHKSDADGDKGYVVANDPATLSSPFRFLGRPDPNFVVDESNVRGMSDHHNGDEDGPNAFKSVAPDGIL